MTAISKIEIVPLVTGNKIDVTISRNGTTDQIVTASETADDRDVLNILNTLLALTSETETIPKMKVGDTDGV